MENNATENYAGRLGQIKIYLGKHFRLFIYQKDWFVLPMSAVIAFMISFVVRRGVFVTMEGTSIGALAMICACIWNGFFNSIQVICRDRNIIKREHRSGLHISSYMISHMIYQAFLCISQVLISMLIYAITGVTYPTTGIITGSFYLEFIFTLFLITYAADMMALMVSCIVKTTTAAMTVMPFLLMFELVFAGIAFPLQGGTEKISYLTISKWGSYAVCAEGGYNSLKSSTLYNALVKMDLFDEAVDMINMSSMVNGDGEIISRKEAKDDLEFYSAERLQVPNYDSTISNIFKDWNYLVAYTVLYAVIGTLILEFIDKDKR